MTDEIARLGIEVDATQADKAKVSLDQLAAAGGRAEASTSKLGKATAVSAEELAKHQAKVIAATVAQTGMTEAQAAAALGFKAVGKEVEAAATSMGHATGQSIKIRESIVLLREAARGDFTRMAGSASILAGAFGLITAETVALVGGVAAAVAPFAILAFAMEKGAEEAAHLNNILAVTNGYSGVTASSFEDMAARMSKASDTGIGKTKANIEAMIASGKFTGDTIEQLVSYSQKLAELTGQDSAKIVAGFDGMKGSLVQFAVKHEETYHDLTLAQIDYIAELEKAGKHHEAELAFARDINSKVQEQVAQYGTLQRVLHDVETAASGMWDALLGIGRPKTQAEQLTAAGQQLNDMLAKNAEAAKLSAQGFGGRTPYSQADILAQRDRIGQLAGAAQTEQANAAAKAKAAQANDDAIQRKYGHFKNGPSDETDQKTSSVDAAVAQAQTAQLQAILGLNTDIEARASIQKQIAASEEAVKSAQIDRQKAEIDLAADQGHITRAVADELMSRLDGVKLLNENTAALKQRLADEQAHDLLIKQAVDLANAQRDAEASVLQAQQALTTDIEARRKIETKLLSLADAKAANDAQAVIDSKLASDADREKARIQIAALQAAAPYRQQLIDQQALTATIHQQADVAQSALQNQVDILSSQADLAEFAGERRAIERRVLDATQQIERSKALEAVWAAYAADDQVAVAKALANLKALTEVQANQARAFNGTGYSNFEDASRAMADVAAAIGQNDWARAAHDLMDALTNAAAILNDTSATFAQKAGAIAGVANGIGNLVGGQGGKAISGAASGAMLGMQIGSIIPGIGNVIGAIGGAIGGAIATFIGDGGKARRAGEDKAAASIASALQSAEQQRYSQQQQQELTLAGLTGDALQETNVKRAQEIAGLDAANRARQQEIYKLQDQADIANKALDDAAQRMMGVHDAAKQASQSLGALYTSLTAGSSALSSPLGQYTQSKTALVGVNTRIAAGDQSAFGDVQGAVTQFLAAAQALAPNKQAYGRDLAFAERSVADAKAQADSQVSLAQQQLDAAHAQVSSIQTVNDSVLTVTEAVKALQAALTGQAAVAAQANTALGGSGGTSGLQHFSQPDYAYFVRQNPDLMAQFTSQSGYARGRDINAYGQIIYTTYGATGRQFTPYGQAFAEGGSMVFGGHPGVDQNQLSLNGAPIAKVSAGEMMTVTPASRMRQGGDNAGAGWAAVVNAINALGSRVDRVEAQTRKTANILQHVSRDGEAFQTQLNVPEAA